VKQCRSSLQARTSTSRTPTARLALVGLCLAALLLGACGARGVVVEPPSTRLETEAGTPTPAPVLPASNVILVDGELSNVYPALKLSFPGNTSGELLALHVQAGQKVKAGDLIAVIDDAELQKAVEDAQTALQRAIEDRDKAEADAQEKYERESSDAEKKYEQESEDAQKKYDQESEDARRDLETAQRDLEQTVMQPPTTAVTEAQHNLAQAIDAEAQAEDDYRQALDRPWENQSIRDSLYKSWQVRIEERKLAELRLEDAKTSLQAHYMDVEAKKTAVANAEADLAGVERDEVEKDEVEKDKIDPSLERAITDAELKLEEAQQQLADARLYAPWDALVMSVDSGVGATIDSGTTIVTLLNVKEMYFVTENLSERHVAQIQTGQQARVTLRTYPDTVLTGEIEFILPRLERQTENDVRFAAYIRLDESEVDLLPGMTGRVEIVTEE
jgi:multidrug efflux pump subunit AcrA (membrane-fusion protein)